MKLNDIEPLLVMLVIGFFAFALAVMLIENQKNSDILTSCAKVTQSAEQLAACVKEMKR
jgi:hypothetical protein